MLFSNFGTISIYRYQRIKIGVCGIAPVKVAGVENINLTHIVTQVAEKRLSLKAHRTNY